VTIERPFAVGKYEVTFAEWDACVTAGGCDHKPGDQGWGRGRRPVFGVSWNDITRQYLPWLNRKTGKSYRLLTEAEW
jgi:formylglycine-generating enzyme required for sulfatase activity